MRQLKFRVWDKTKSEMFYPTQSVDWTVGINGEVFYHCGSSIKENVIVQQYTGLLDSKGIDIYEGDLLEFAYKNDSMKFVGEVTYSNKFACFIVVIDKAFETFSDLADYTNYFLVVGNICEQDKNYNE
jgi:hypothetical protein